MCARLRADIPSSSALVVLVCGIDHLHGRRTERRADVISLSESFRKFLIVLTVAVWNELSARTLV